MNGQTSARSGPGMIIGLILLLLFTTGIPLSASTTLTPVKEDFPIFPSIRPNVNFWKKVFAVYDSSQGLIHDTRHLNRVYEVIRLAPENTIRGARKNKKIKKAVLKKYKSVLLRLAKGSPPATPLEKKVAALLGPGAGPKDFKRAAFNLRCQTGIKDRFREGLIRSGAFIEEFKAIFLSHGLPTDLVYLASVESSFDTKAYSKFGAAGIWQFTRETGRLFMKINYVVDQRRDPFVSTDAAARLLKKNHARLREWPLAITAYNHGLAGMARAKRAKGSYERIFNSYNGRSFRFASRNFYSEFLAARETAKNYKTYFGELDFAKPVKTTRFKTRGYIPAKPLSEAVGLSMSEIRAMNPALRPPVFKGQKHIPKGFELRFPGHIPHNTISEAASALYQARQKPSRFHRVQKGDTAGAIARTHGVSVSDLILTNGLGRKAVIYIGQNLRIPAREEIILAQNRKKALKSKPEDKTKPAPRSEPVIPPPAPAPEQAKEVSPVQAPEKIIQKEEKTGDSDTLNGDVAGQLQARPLTDPGKISINPEIPTDSLKIKKAPSKGDQAIGIIKVAPEETLGHYADWLKIPTSRLRSLNRIKMGKQISIDQEIKIPIPVSGKEDFEEQRYEFHKEMEEDFFESFRISDVETYVIKNGDTLWDLCLNELEIPIWLLKKYNPNMNFNALRPRQKIQYPIVDKKQDHRDSL
ncbi:LysM peptidoglycan-binding domain-containing protein [Desulfospira joergensenii]|uniref:LysM peptidoglycan-binding domain-containing protein n=1 Tax=Desulfospira joergensenii TaxID=53329 RepID=UPI0013781F3E|nr:LysM peptidoglycan-binding domain-containing protein [Desulfospira joergensenii]